MNSTVPQSLCVCLTPLHVLIASRVSEEKQSMFELGIYMAYQDDPKQQHYYDRMKQFCRRVEFVKTPEETYPKGLKKYAVLLKRRRQFLSKFAEFGKFSYVLASSSINHYLWCLLQASRPSALETYDDGLLNIARTPVKHYQKTSWSEMLLLRMGGVRFTKEKIIEQSLKHYSIYKDKNWFSRQQHIPLHAEPTQPAVAANQVSKEEIFIGPAPEAPEIIWDLIERYLKQYPNTVYLKHPRDSSARFGFAGTLETNFIIEDYVLQQTRESGREFVLCGTESSALINLAQVKNVSARSILPNMPEYREARNLMARHGVLLIHAE